MTESELVEAWGIFLGNSQTAMALYLSILSGYLIIAYIVGRKLSRVQVIILSTMFFFASAFCTLVLTTWWQRALEFAHEARAINPERIVSNSQEGVYTVAVLFSVGILASLYFMWNVRHSNPD
jgi:hypothetical protein